MQHALVPGNYWRYRPQSGQEPIQVKILGLWGTQVNMIDFERVSTSAEPQRRNTCTVGYFYDKFEPVLCLSFARMGGLSCDRIKGHDRWCESRGFCWQIHTEAVPVVAPANKVVYGHRAAGAPRVESSTKVWTLPNPAPGGETFKYEPKTRVVLPNPHAASQRSHVMKYYGYDLMTDYARTTYSTKAIEIEADKRWADPVYRASYCGLKK